MAEEFVWECKECGNIEHSDMMPEDCSNCLAVGKYDRVPEDMIEEKQAEQILSMTGEEDDEE